MSRKPTPAAVARRRELGRERARRWRERHAASVYALEVTAAVAAVDAALVDALIEVHVAHREATGDRDAPLPLRAVVHAARELLAGDGMPALDALVAVRERLRAGALSLPADVARVPTPGLSVAA